MNGKNAYGRIVEIILPGQFLSGNREYPYYLLQLREAHFDVWRENWNDAFWEDIISLRACFFPRLGVIKKFKFLLTASVIKRRSGFGAFHINHPFDSDQYIQSVYRLHLLLSVFNRFLPEEYLSVNGASFNKFNESSIREILHRAPGDRTSLLSGFLSEKIKILLQKKPRAIAFRIEGFSSLYTGLLCASLIKAARPEILIVFDQGWENFSLKSILRHLYERTEFGNLVDIVNINKSYFASGFFQALHTVLSGRPPEELAHIPNIAVSRTLGGHFNETEKGPNTYNPNLFRTLTSRDLADPFSDIPRTMLRYSDGPCFNNCCTFCVQNRKYFSEQPENENFLAAALAQKIEILHEKGARFFILLDEAVHPSAAFAIASEILKRKLKIHWSFRSVFHPGFTQELFHMLGKSGCREILFGIESTHPDTLYRMKKRSRHAADLEVIRSQIGMIEQAGIAPHLCIMCGFPGETVKAFEQKTLKDFSEIIQTHAFITFSFNFFTLFRGTDVYMDPAAFEIELEAGHDKSLELKIGFRHLNNAGIYPDASYHRSTLLNFIRTCGIYQALPFPSHDAVLQVFYEMEQLSFSSLMKLYFQKNPLRRKQEAKT